jgi:predicted Fe-Mo cluster-binding NifX family protein
MILLISAQQSALDGPIERRFGRAPWLISFDTETSQWEAFENPGVSLSGGAGVAAAQFVIDKKGGVVISGDFGPHAANAFRSANIEMRLFTDEVVSVKNSVDHYFLNKLPVFK